MLRSTGTTKKPKRGTRRVLFAIPLIIEQRDAPANPFKAETINVNREGARIRTRNSLEAGMWLKVTAAEPYRTVEARVVWAKPDVNEYGLELQHPGNFWGIVFPPDDWEEPFPPVPAFMAPGTPVTTPVSSPIQLQHAPVGVMPGISAAGTHAIITGMSAVRMPFQASGLLSAAGKSEATMLVKPTVVPGTQLRIIVDQKVYMARVHAVSNQREQGSWRLWLRFD